MIVSGQRGLRERHGPLSPALSPSEGERETRRGGRSVNGPLSPTLSPWEGERGNRRGIGGRGGNGPLSLALSPFQGEREEHCRRLAVGGAGDDQAVEVFQGLAIIQKPKGEPIEQLGMRRQSTHVAKIVRRLHDPAPEMIMPNTVYNGTACEQVRGICNPAGQRSAAETFIAGIRNPELR